MIPAIVKEICRAFRVESMAAVADSFGDELENALQNRNSSLNILPSFLSLPGGLEEGKYIAIDMGGTNVRVMCLHLQGNGRYTIHREIIQPLKDPIQGYDLTGADSTGAQLFGFIARLIDCVSEAGQAYTLGFTFSYPMQQDAIDRAQLTHWTKEISTAGVVGKDIKAMLTRALEERGLTHIVPVAILNDTVASLMAGAYSDPAACVGSICGTGYNTCYNEASIVTGSLLPMIVNIEAGNFALAPGNAYDWILDQGSLDSGRQRFEKMVSGKYMGELFRLAFLDLINKGLLPASQENHDSIHRPFSAGSEVLNWLSINGDVERGAMTYWLKQRGFPPYKGQQLDILKMVATAILDRAVLLIAASFIPLLRRNKGRDHGMVVAVDGSVFEKIPGFSRRVEKALNQSMRSIPVSLVYVRHGSLIGAAVAAAQIRSNQSEMGAGMN